MNNISLDKLRTLAAAVADAEQGSKAWDKATDALSDKFSPQCLVKLIDQLKAAQHEQAVNWEAATSLAEENGELKRQLEAAQRERDEYAESERRTAVRNTTLTDENYGLRAELKRRDAQKPAFTPEKKNLSNLPKRKPKGEQKIPVGTYCIFDGKYDKGFACRVLGYEKSGVTVQKISNFETTPRQVKEWALIPTTRENAYFAAKQRGDYRDA
ncbi:hypothetical protein [Erwinia sp. S38]|uniref:hypothetical protein n=1 Tax=Erwinia sp. S38 TaxID=2769338 RepID=UPI001909BBBF|nr:hypothetical protein [Erwinia sp. S38]MBK0004732.1 hypothetical protein [Erwinia sp. S38]